jgi:Zn-dependent peptidase ImmA (M78 family)
LIDSLSIERLEVQANIFATNLLISDAFCIEITEEYLKDKNIREKYIYFDHQPCNKALAF